MSAVASLVCGLLFGFGLQLSGMTDPIKVLGFLDVLGRWDPTLAFVMAGALAVSVVGFAQARRRAAPMLAAQYQWPTRTDVDRPLVIGSMLFGVGWGLAGLCPGPALVNLATLSRNVLVFAIAMVAGMIAKDLWERHAPSATAIEDAALANADG